MKLHARSMAMSAGAKGKLVDVVAEEMVRQRKVRFDVAKDLVRKLSDGEHTS